jgi:hypothetical protein
MFPGIVEYGRKFIVRLSNTRDDERIPGWTDKKLTSI